MEGDHHGMMSDVSDLAIGINGAPNVTVIVTFMDACHRPTTGSDTVTTVTSQVPPYLLLAVPTDCLQVLVLLASTTP